MAPLRVAAGGGAGVKTKVEELAVFGGESAFEKPLHVGRPNIGNRARFEERVRDILDRAWLTNGGRYVREFEGGIAQALGVEHCVAMCNGTVALEVAVRALGMSGEVIVPSFTFVATANALRWQGITPVFADVDPFTHTLDPRRVEELITPRTTGILAVHLWGRACAIDELSDIAKRHGLRLLFDAAHAFGCSYRGRRLGGFGDAEVLSFHATKFLNSLEGGAVVTNDAALASRVRLMKNFGFSDYDRTERLGINGKMNEVSAAMGLTNLESIDEFIAVNRRNHQQYVRELADIPGVDVLRYDESERQNYQYVVLEVEADSAGLTRDEMVTVLHAERVLARRYFFPGCHQMEPYRSERPEGSEPKLPHTERLAARLLSLPTGTGVRGVDIAAICALVRVAMVSGGEVAARLRRGAPSGAGVVR